MANEEAAQGAREEAPDEEEQRNDVDAPSPVLPHQAVAERSEAQLMLSESAFEAYVTRLRLSEPAVKRLRAARNAAPDRAVGSQRHNVSGRSPSRKMGETRQFEARGTEGLGLLEYEYSDEVLEYYDQPAALVVHFLDAAGQRRGVRTRVDYLVLERGGVFLDEWKTEEELVKLAAAASNRYLRTDAGWRSPPAEEAAQQLGFRFRLRTPASVDPALVKNAAFLAEYRLSTDSVPVSDRDPLIAAVRADPGLVIGQLLARVGSAQADNLYRLIADGTLFVDLTRYTLAQPFQAPVWPSAVVAAAAAARPGEAGPPESSPAVELRGGETVLWSGRSCLLANVTASTVWLRPTDGELVALTRDEVERLIGSGSIRTLDAGNTGDAVPDAFRTASPQALAEAERRFRILERYWNDSIAEVPSSTLSDWQRRYRAEEIRTGFGLAGLLPGRRGRKSEPQLEPAVEDLMQAQIDSFYDTLDAPSAKALHGRVVKACQEAGLAAPCYATVRARLQQRDRHSSDHRRSGHKKAYETAPHYWYLAADTPRHGERPWERFHIDHTQLDIVAVDSESGLSLGRPWLTLLIDAHTRRIAAFWITFDPPSYRSLMMVLRRCVERWNRLPETILVDGGAEFGSVYFEQFLARWRVKKEVRPGEPRFGSVIERFFGSLNQRLLHQLRGNTKMTRNVRQLTPSTDPAARAVWNLAALGGLLDEFFFDVYEQLDHPALGAAPRAFYEARMAITGVRPSRLIPYDEGFRMSTLPTTAKQTAKIDRVQGVKINGRRYRAPEFRGPDVHGRRVPVRYDPMDARHAYAYLDGRWVECWCSELRGFGPVSEREIAHLSAEMQQRLRLHRRSARRDALRVADFIDVAGKREEALLQARRDAASRSLLNGDFAEPSIRRTVAAESVEAVQDADGAMAAAAAPTPDAQPTPELEIFDAY